MGAFWFHMEDLLGLNSILISREAPISERLVRSSTVAISSAGLPLHASALKQPQAIHRLFDIKSLPEQTERKLWMLLQRLVPD
jgi:hypothetical protein